MENTSENQGIKELAQKAWWIWLIVVLLAASILIIIGGLGLFSLMTSGSIKQILYLWNNPFTFPIWTGIIGGGIFPFLFLYWKKIISKGTPFTTLVAFIILGAIVTFGLTFIFELFIIGFVVYAMSG